MSDLSNNILVFSMIVPFYRGSEYLDRLINMAYINYQNLKRKYENISFELIIVNDCIYETVELTDKQCICDKGFRIVVHNNNTNKGIHGTKITGFGISKGDYILFLDQDDLISDDYFVSQFEIIGEYDAVVCNAEWGYGPMYTQGNIEALDIATYLKGKNGIVSLGQVLLKKTSIPKEWLTYILEKNGADDYYLMLLLLVLNKKCIEHRGVLYFHVNTGNNYSSDWLKIRDSLYEVVEMIENRGFITKKEELNIKNHIEKYEIKENNKDRNSRLAMLFDRWIYAIENNYKICSYLLTYGKKKVAIYGAGHLGVRLAKWLKKELFDIVFFVDQYKKNSIDGIPILNIGEVNKNDNICDLIIVSPIDISGEFLEELKEELGIIVISLEQIIYNAPCFCLNKKTND